MLVKIPFLFPTLGNTPKRMKKDIILQILNSEMDVATGCTEPASVALCAAYAASQLSDPIESIVVFASVNIIKNAMAAGIPGTDITGVACAASVGAMCQKPGSGLLILDNATTENVKAASELLVSGKVTVHIKKDVDKLYTETIIKDMSGNKATAVIAGTHTNLCLLKLNDKVISSGEVTSRKNGISSEIIEDALSIADIYDFAENIDIEKDDLDIIKKAIKINSAIADAGEKNAFNLHVGRSIHDMQKDKIAGEGIVEVATRRTACGIDARMGGAKLPVVTNSGSGNQGITATMPVLSAAEYFAVGEEKTIVMQTL